MQLSMWRKITSLLLFVGFLNLFLFHAFGTVAFSIIIIGFFLFILSLFVTHDDWPIQKSTILPFGTLLLTLLLMLINRNNWFVGIILGLSSLITLVLFLYLMSTQIPFVRSLLELILVPVNLGLVYFKAGLSLLYRLLTTHSRLPSSASFYTNRVKSILVGLLIGLPVVFALVVLLSGADPIYAKFIQSLLSFKLPVIPEKLRIKIVFSLFWLTVLAPLLLLKRASEFHSPLSSLRSTTFTREMTVVMSLVALVLGSFLVIQAPYVFVNVVAEIDLSKYGVATYSEYVKKGFGEFLFISLFIYSLIWLGLIFMRGKRKQEKGVLPYVQLLVLAEFGIFLLSIFRRIWLYQTHHGWSLVRIYGGLFLVWVTFITITLALRHLKERRYIIAEVGFTAALIIWTGVFNAEHFIATTHPPTVNKRVDYVYLSRMSADGFEGWKKAYAYAEEVLVNRRLQDKQLINREARREVSYAGVIINQLLWKHTNLVFSYGTLNDIKTFNLDVLTHMKRKNDLILSQMNPEEATKSTYVQNNVTGNYYMQKELAELTNLKLSEKLEQIATVSLQRKSEFGIDLHHDALPYNYYRESFCRTYPEPYCLKSFFTLPYADKTTSTFDTTLNQIFTWNGSNARTFAVLQNEIAYQKLLEMESLFFELADKISRQPAEEQEYDIDISFDTPFLGSL